jgi:hypothetical protein
MTTKDKSDTFRYRKNEYYDTKGIVDDTTSEDFSDDVVKREVFNGADLPGYRSVIKVRGNATNNAFAYRRDLKMANGVAFHTTIQRGWETGDDGNAALVTYQTTTYRTSGMWDPVAGPAEPELDLACVDLAKARFVSKCRQAMSPTAGGVILGEIRETIHAIRHPAEALRAGIGAYLTTVKKRGRGFRKASDAKKNAMVSGTWLEYNFGWAPLLHDIDNAMESLAKVVTGIQPLTPVRATVRLPSPPTEDQSVTGGGGFENATYSITTKGKSVCQVYGAINTTIAQPTSFLSAFGLRPHDFLPTIWELIPYSFVADYFTNLGDIISAAAFSTSYLSWHGMSTVAETERYSHNFQRTGTDHFTELQDSFGSITPGVSRATYKKFARTVAPDLVPELRFSIPGVKQGFNLLALFQQARATRF